MDAIGTKARFDSVFRQNVQLLQLIQALAHCVAVKPNPFAALLLKEFKSSRSTPQAPLRCSLAAARSPRSLGKRLDTSASPY